jgi:phosphate:Na+ symporter
LNPGTLVIVNLLGDIALLLWGVRMVRTGVMRAWGDRLKSFIEHRLDSRVSAFLAGGVATAILGSGTAMTLILAGIAAARRLPLANLLCRGIAAIAALVGIDWIIPLATRLPLPPVETAVTFHTAFNVATGLLFLPLTGFVAAAMRRLVPDEKQEADRLASPRYLDIAAMATPSVALSNAMLETVRMSEVLDRMFDTALAALRTGSLETLKQLKPLDERLNAYQAALQSYLSDLAQQPLGAEDSRRILELTLYISNLEHACDVIHLNLSDRIKAKAKQSVAFSPEEQASLDDLCLIVHQNIRLATGVLSSGDIEGAKRLIAQKDAFRALENEVLNAQFRPGSRRTGAALKRSALYVDMIRDLRRINSHIVAAGYPIVDAAGLLRESRLRGASPNLPPSEPA